MPKVAGPPLRKVTLNLYDEDVVWFQLRHGLGYSTIIRDILHGHVERNNRWDENHGDEDGRE